MKTNTQEFTTRKLVVMTIFTAIAVLITMLASGCDSLKMPEGSQIGGSGNTTNAQGFISVPVTDTIIVTATGQINPQNPSDWGAGIIVTFKSYEASTTVPRGLKLPSGRGYPKGTLFTTDERLSAIASAGGKRSNCNPMQFFIPDDSVGEISTTSMLGKVLAAIQSDRETTVAYNFRK